MSLYASLEDLLREQQPEAVIIGTPNPIHLANIREAAERGLHVSVTKPLCNTVRDSRAAIEVCRARGVLLQVGHEYRFRPPMRRLIELAGSGAIGRLSLAVAHMGSGGGMGQLTATGAWRSRAANVPGGCLNLLGVHFFDVLNAVLGRPVSVMASVKKLLTAAELEDTAAVIVEYESGAVGMVSSSYVSAECDFVRVFGTEANLLGDDQRLYREERRALTSMGGLPSESSGAMVIRQLCGAIRSGQPLDTPGEAGLWTVAMNEAALVSHREGRRVMLAEMLQ